MVYNIIHDYKWISNVAALYEVVVWAVAMAMHVPVSGGGASYIALKAG